MPFTHVVDAAELATLYRPPSTLVINKSHPTIDAATAAFIGQSTFAIVSTSASNGTLDASPRGGEPGFVQVIDEHRLAIADLGGNNRLDSIRNVVDTGQIGVLFIVVGRTETVRVNGTACVTTDPTVLDAFPSTFRRPKAAIGIDVVETFIHCAKAFQRGRVWDPEMWAGNAAAPDAVDIILCQSLVDGDHADLRRLFDVGYAQDLAEELPDR